MIISKQKRKMSIVIGVSIYALFGTSITTIAEEATLKHSDSGKPSLKRRNARGALQKSPSHGMQKPSRPSPLNLPTRPSSLNPGSAEEARRKKFNDAMEKYKKKIDNPATTEEVRKIQFDKARELYRQEARRPDITAAEKEAAAEKLKEVGKYWNKDH